MYAVVQLVGPLGVILVIFGGASHDHTLLIAGVVLIGLFLIDTLIVWPVGRARRDLHRRSRGQL
jgi:hypothetical protein